MSALLILLCLQDTVQERVDRYFAEPDAKILKSLKDADFEIVERAVRSGGSSRAWDRAGTVVERSLKTEVGGKEFPYWLYVPEGYDPKKRYRLFVSLHGQNGNGKDHIRLWLPDMRKRNDTILVSPSVVRESWGQTKRGQSHVRTLVRALSLEFSIDPNQVWMGGVSMGGAGTFRIATSGPSRFAGLIPRVQGPKFITPVGQKPKKDHSNAVPRLVENLIATPIYWIVGKNDAGVPITLMRKGKEKLESLRYDLTWREMDGGHESFPQENAAVLKWMEERARNPYPQRVRFWSETKDGTRAYWAEITKFARIKTVKFRIHDFDGKPIATREQFVEDIKVEASLDRKNNAINATVKNATEVVFYLSDRMLDLNEKVTITVNGSRVYNKKVKRDVKFMLEDARERGDRGMTFSAKVKVRVR